MVVGDLGLISLAPFNTKEAIQLTARLQLHISLLHNAKVWVAREHLRPFLHALQDLRFDLLMCVLSQLAYCIYQMRAENKLTLSLASRNSASVKLRDASSR